MLSKSLILLKKIRVAFRIFYLKKAFFALT